MNKFLLTAAAALLSIGVATDKAVAAGASVPIPAQEWSFSGPFGAFDKAQLQRGFQVYREVCAGCHALNLIAFRNLNALGYNEEEIKSIAAEYEVMDGPNDEGEMFTRAAIPADYFPKPFDNPEAAKAANGGAYPPDLSLMPKKRVGGADYVYALLVGYEDPPADFAGGGALYYNKYFPGNAIAMAPPISEDAVEFADGTAATVEQQARDISAFLTWTAEPELEDRKSMGLKVMLFLLVFTAVAYASKRKIWADLH